MANETVSSYSLEDYLKTNNVDYTVDADKNLNIGGFTLPSAISNLLGTSGNASNTTYKDILSNIQKIQANTAANAAAATSDAAKAATTNFQDQSSISPTSTVKQQSSITTPTTTTTTDTPTYVSPYTQQMTDLLTQLNAITPYETSAELEEYVMNLIQSANTPFTYDPSTDQALKIAQQEADRQVREGAGAKGTLYSSGTIGTSARQQGALIPQYEATAYGRYSDTQNRKIQMATTLMQWDEMQASRWQDQLKLVQTKFDYVMQLDSQNFEEFKMMLEQKNFNKEFELKQAEFNLNKKQLEIQQAYDRVNATGYVDKNTSIILGLPVGTKAQWVQELELAQKQQLDAIAKEFANEKTLQKSQAAIDKSLIAYKQKLEDASAAKQMSKQYELDKKLASYSHSLDMGTASGVGGNSIVSTAKTLSGLKYVYGGTSTTKGMDCSAFTQWACKQNGITLPRTAAEQSKVGTAVSWDNMQPGDLIFYNTIAGNGKSVDHVGIYVGDGKMIHESSSKGVVTTVLGSYWKNLYTTSRRVSGGTSTTKSSSSVSKSDSISSYQGATGKISSSISSKYSVKTVQTYLKQSGYSVSIDGAYGKSTTQAVKNFQKAHGLKADGIVGPSTIAALKKAAAAKTSSKKTTTKDAWAVGSGYYG